MKKREAVVSIYHPEEGLTIVVSFFERVKFQKPTARYTIKFSPDGEHAVVFSSKEDKPREEKEALKAHRCVDKQQNRSL